MTFMDKLSESYTLLKKLKLMSAYSLVTRLGKPIVTNNSDITDTAAVCLSEGKLSKIKFVFNKDFAEKLSIKEMAAVLIHEAYHVFFGHIFSKHGNLNHKVWNLACDAVINDMIEFHFKDDVKLPELRITGQNLIGENCKDKTSEEVYNICMSKFEKSLSSIYIYTTMDDHRMWDEHNKNEDVAEKMEEEINKIMNSHHDQITRGVISKKDSFGSAKSFSKRKISINTKKQVFNKKELLANLTEIMPKNINDQNMLWSRPSRKLISIYPKIVLPSYEQKTKPRGLFVIDTSASISDEWLSIFKEICQKCSKIMHSEFFSFDTTLNKWDLSETNIYGGGGTSISCIEKYCNESSRYPDNIVVLTDGYFSGGHDLKHPERWTFLIKTSYRIDRKQKQVEDKIIDQQFVGFYISEKSKRIYLR